MEKAINCIIHINLNSPNGETCLFYLGLCRYINDLGYDFGVVLSQILIFIFANFLNVLLQGELSKFFMGEGYNNTDPMLYHLHCV